ncbi:hypothetical protein [Meinhardsimonia xiamenensis]|jgi:hypothetical protein|nr:hypothetical protein [Meinhardsimonia xiamenensis]
MSASLEMGGSTSEAWKEKPPKLAQKDAGRRRMLKSGRCKRRAARMEI